MIELLIVFLCPHGGAKSVIAAEYFNRAAAREGLPYVAVAAAAETPYESVPKPVADFLAREGIDVANFKPRPVDACDLENATSLIAIDCEVPKAERWTDVPKVSEDLEGSAAAIKRHVEELVRKLKKAR